MRTESRRERDFCAAFELIGEQLVAAHTVLERKPVRDNGAQIVLSVAHEREKPLHIMTHWTAAGAVGEVLVIGFARRESEARFGVDANGGDDTAGTN